MATDPPLRNGMTVFFFFFFFYVTNRQSQCALPLPCNAPGDACHTCTAEMQMHNDSLLGLSSRARNIESLADLVDCCLGRDVAIHPDLLHEVGGILLQGLLSVRLLQTLTQHRRHLVSVAQVRDAGSTPHGCLRCATLWGNAGFARSAHLLSQYDLSQNGYGPPAT
mmetsp:Transcript_2394/g.1955  ORF Transcript_2394/g.1955 Transcript_2394/m.1955 type:complete len:166 (-) Transcript_2394:35-532(-)